jgi:hypothetical protein
VHYGSQEEPKIYNEACELLEKPGKRYMKYLGTKQLMI